MPGAGGSAWKSDSAAVLSSPPETAPPPQSLPWRFFFHLKKKKKKHFKDVRGGGKPAAVRERPPGFGHAGPVQELRAGGLLPPGGGGAPPDPAPAPAAPAAACCCCCCCCCCCPASRPSCLLHAQTRRPLDRQAAHGPADSVFKSLVMKIRKPQTTARIFQSGILFCTGAKSEGESRVAARKFAFKILKLGYPVRFLDFKVLNIGGTCKTFPINLEDLFLAHQDHCSYEPELFPALQYNFRPGMTASIFSSGSVSLVGAKTEDEFYRAFRSLDAILTGFRRT
ncbi:TATA-box-binding protein-like isoform X1 [Syngnathoides biaculeatus]|uniref:TATA-box-binding protein-like isoform X1 n=1 Tax=Syngnathoides biaculeatus TaxID=300417 RepID=UPI002ADE2052|nr:TATA-box-binding protein-like isoform X1 [Syngnathoides biaculeatus]